METMFAKQLINLAFITTILIFTPVSANAEDSPQMKALRKMTQLLEKGKYEQFYSKWLHPDVYSQFTQEEFAEQMDTAEGKLITKLFSEIIEAIDAGKDENIVSTHERPGDCYEFILMSKAIIPRSERNGPFKLELKLHKGNWKSKDVD